MKLTFIGVGGAFAPLSKGQSNMFFTADDGSKLLLDLGDASKFILRDEMGLQHSDFEGVYISHLHGDHIGGMEWFALMHYFVKAKNKPKLFGRSNVLSELWQKSLRGGLETLEGEDPCTLNTYFDINRIKENGLFKWKGYTFKTVQTNHISYGFEFKNSYGLLVQRDSDDTCKEYQKTFITTDTQFCPSQLLKTYGIADLIFHDCETLPFKSNVHAHYDDLCTLDEGIKNKMWLYHHAEVRDDVIDQGFRGFCEKGQSFEI